MQVERPHFVFDKTNWANSKLQIPNPKQIPIFNVQISNQFEYCNLIIEYCLEFGT